ncbi:MULTISPECIES: hypothetical protein [Halococcus]|uniref:Uncharacterized protein n=1 Tax=Halococcus salifodinae DSM 8989 TaxID=1227456 RepID=M0N8F1_9EURY|nr:MULTISPECIES: hypothetical protein [Halococcus]EMA53379.1 hypothetical protein C450_08702 [Halococcus salifodinae DSM 8989]
MAILDSVVIFLVSLILGTVGIYAGVRLVADRDVGYTNAAITALIGALVWGLVSFFIGWVPLLGPLLMLVIWIGVINWRYPGGWVAAAGIGLVAWVVVFIVAYVLATVGFITPDALGVPGI